jgi:hypothetical protein
LYEEPTPCWSNWDKLRACRVVQASLMTTSASGA